MKVFVAIFLVILSASASASSNFNGNDMLEGCKKVTELPHEAGNLDFGSGLCVGVISGVIHASEFAGFEHGTKLFCMPDGVSILQIARIMHKYLSETPEVLHVTAGTLTAFALSNKYPCKSTG